jgi:hypothetical protein
MSHSEKKIKTKGLQSARKTLKENSLRQSIHSAKKERFSKTLKENISNIQKKTSAKEEELDTLQLDNVVNNLFTKFIIHYEYQDLFKIKEEFKNQSHLPIDSFGNKLEVYFGIYKIKRVGNNNLTANCKEGCYILRHAKIWIIFIKDFMDKNKVFKSSEICDIFKNALSLGVDEQLLFDYFIHIFKEKSEEEIKDLSANYIPEEFKKLYFENKELIMKRFDDEIESEEEKVKMIEAIQSVVDEEVKKGESVKREERNLSFGENTLVVTEMKKEISEIDEIMSPKRIQRNNLDISMKQSDIKEEVKLPESEAKSNESTLNEGKAFDETNDAHEINTNAKSSDVLGLIYNKINTGYALEEESPHVLNKESKPVLNNEDPLTQYLIMTPEVRLPTILETEEELQKTVKIKSVRNQFNLIDTLLLDSNFRNSGNFAILEVAESSRQLLDQKFIITPLREKHDYNQKLSVADDLNKIRQSYTDFMYKPFSIEIIEQIKNDSKPKKRLSFSNI